MSLVDESSYNKLKDGVLEYVNALKNHSDDLISQIEHSLSASNGSKDSHPKKGDLNKTVDIDEEAQAHSKDYGPPHNQGLRPKNPQSGQRDARTMHCSEARGNTSNKKPFGLQHFSCLIDTLDMKISQLSQNNSNDSQKRIAEQLEAIQAKVDNLVSSRRSSDAHRNTQTGIKVR